MSSNIPKVVGEGNSYTGGEINGEPITRFTAASSTDRSTVLVNAGAACTPATNPLKEKSLKLILNCDALPNKSRALVKLVSAVLNAFCAWSEIPDANDPKLEPILVKVEVALSAHAVANSVPYLLPFVINAPMSPLSVDDIEAIVPDTFSLVNPDANPEICDTVAPVDAVKLFNVLESKPTAPVDKLDNAEVYEATASAPSL
jgi:hypothetical protein